MGKFDFIKETITFQLLGRGMYEYYFYYDSRRPILLSEGNWKVTNGKLILTEYKTQNVYELIAIDNRRFLTKGFPGIIGIQIFENTNF